MRSERSYPVEIVRVLEVGALAEVSSEEADRFEEDGLVANRHYRDLRGVTWRQLADALEQEAALFDRFAAASDLDEEAERYEEERLEAVFPEEDLWGLDVGVIAATLALSALGATPISSCNAGGFGGRHTGRFPHVAFYLPRALAAEVRATAEAADVGLDVLPDGIARLFGKRDRDLHRFAQAALLRPRASSPERGGA